MNKLTFYVGLFDKDTKIQRFTTTEAYKIVERFTAETFGGGTISESTGIYRHDDGTVVVEPSLRIEVYTQPERLNERLAVSEFIATLKKVLNQESILVEESQIQYDFR